MRTARVPWRSARVLGKRNLSPDKKSQVVSDAGVVKDLKKKKEGREEREKDRRDASK